jgi:hypothetical protein
MIDSNIARRDILARGPLGFGLIALADLLELEQLIADDGERGTVPVTHHRAMARRVIFLFMGGGPSQVDTWDPKPELTRLDGQSVPDSIAKDVPKIARSPLVGLFASPFRFTRRGDSGIEVSELFPEIGGCVDDLCVIRSCRHDSPIHAPAEFIATTGTGVGDRPSLGAWLAYGLGSENSNLPSFVVMKSGETIRPPTIGSGFLPATFQGTMVDADRGIPNLRLPDGVTAEERREQLDLLNRFNRRHAERLRGQSDLDARIQAYELSFRMQMHAPEVFDIAGETQETRRLYGLDEKETAEFGKYCLWARRLVERGVRFIQLRSGGWDQHSKLREEHAAKARATDRPIAALLRDLRRRGLLDETLVIWGGEFGRTPAAQGSGPQVGRDHSPSGYSMWLAGGGVRGGQVIGATDPVGYAAVDRPVHPNDLHATILHALGVDQHRLFYPHRNRRELVTVNGGQVIHEVFA